MGGGGGGGIGGVIGDVGKVIGPALPITGGLAGSIGGIPGIVAGGSLGESVRDSFQPGTPPQAPGMDPRYAKIKESQEKQAKEFRENLPSFENQQFDRFRKQRLQDLQGESKTTDLNMFRRGLNSGGLAQGAQAKAVANASYDLSKGREDIRMSAEDTANQLEADALNSGMLLQRTQQGIQDTIYNQAIKDYQNRNAAIGAIGSGIGSGIGIGLGRR